MNGREARKGANEAWFRDVNERLEERAVAGVAVAPEFDAICECSEESCTERIRIGLADYERVRARPTTFLVRLDHAELDVERVLSTHDGFAVVEKFGDAAEVAERSDLREQEER